MTELHEKDSSSSSSSSSSSLHTYIHTYNNSTTQPQPPKILRSFKIHVDTDNILNVYSTFLHSDKSQVVEWALQDYFIKNAAKIPVDVSFKIVVQDAPTPRVKKPTCRVMTCGRSAKFLLVDTEGSEAWFCEEHSLTPLRQGWTLKEGSR